MHVAKGVPTFHVPRFAAERLSWCFQVLCKGDDDQEGETTEAILLEATRRGKQAANHATSVAKPATHVK